jgi:thiamine-phosphate diphosphorylase
MRPLPRLHAVTDAAILASEDPGIRAAAIAATGPVTALHVRDHSAGGARLAAVTTRFLALARPPEAAVVVNGHPEIAQATGAQGVQLRAGDLSPRDARRVLGAGWIGASVHSREEAESAAAEGADFLLLGTIFESASHPGQQAAGVQLIRDCAGLALPIIAIGGMNPGRARQCRDAGAYGVAAISALWLAPDPAAAALALLSPWMDEA